MSTIPTDWTEMENPKGGALAGTLQALKQTPSKQNFWSVNIGYTWVLKIRVKKISDWIFYKILPDIVTCWSIFEFPGHYTFYYMVV